MSQRKRLALIDGHALAFRAFFALKDAGLRSSRGEPTYAVFGFASILLSMIQEQRPDYVAVSFDIGRTFRDDLYADYKAGRAETPEEFHPQLDRIKQLVAALNIPVYVAEGFEADDVIGTLATQATAQDVETLILTGDTDSLQLVNDHVRVLLANPYGGRATTTIYDEAKVRERYEGLAPGQLADLRGLKGDTSDNIPGVKGIGEKGAISLLNQFGTVEQLYDRFAEVPNRYKKPLDGQREAALFSKKLATIVCDAPVQLDLAHAALGDYDRSAVIALFQELEIGANSGLLKKLPGGARGDGTSSVSSSAAPADSDGRLQNATSSPAPLQQGLWGDSQSPRAEALPAALPGAGGPAQLSMFDMGDAPPAAAGLPPVAGGLQPPQTPALGSYTAITTPAQLAELVEALRAAPGFAFDTESGGLFPFQSPLVGVSVAHTPGSAAYIPFGHSQGQQLPREEVLDALRPLFEDPAKPKYAHNAKFDIELLLAAGVKVRGLTCDTMIAAALLGKRHGLKELSFYELKLTDPPTPIEELIGRGSKQITFGEVPIERATPYAAADADLTLRLVPLLEAQLRELPQLFELYQRLELPLIDVLVGMEEAGISLDGGYITELGRRLGARIGELEQQIYAEAKGSFNINSGQQLNEVLFGRLGIDPKPYGLSKLKTGGYSLTAEVFEQMSAAHPIAELILRYRQLSKLKSTYVDALPGLINPRTGRIHTTYNQVGAATGRLSCLPAGTLVNTQHGLVGIEQVRPGDMIRTAFGIHEVRAWQETGQKPVVVLQLSNGITLRCSPEHRLRSLGRWVEARELMVGDPLYMSSAPGMFGTETKLNLTYTSHYDTRKTPSLPTDWTIELAELIGYHMADGHISRSNYNNKPSRIILAFSWEDDELIDYFSPIVQDLFSKPATKRITRTCPILQISGVDIAGAFEQIGAGGKSGVIRVPPGIFRAPESIVAGFLRGYFEGDGMVHQDMIAVRSVSMGMLTDVQQLLTMFGIPSRISTGSPDPRGYAPRHTLRIAGRADPLFQQKIGFLATKKHFRSINAAYVPAEPHTSRNGSDLITLPRSLDIDELKPAIYAATRINNGRIPGTVQAFTSKLATGQSHAITKARAEWMASFLTTKNTGSFAAYLREIVDGGYFEVSITAISHEVPVKMYDIAVDNVQQYIANGVIVHNSNDPNVQNIPVRTEEGREIRRGFVAAPGHRFVAADYSQIELRVLAHYMEKFHRDSSMAEAFRAGRDIHATTASRLFGVEIDGVDKNQRRIAKTVVFGVIYGISAFGLSQRLAMARGEAQGLIDGIFREFPGLRAYIEATLAFGREHGYVSTLFGRRRQMADLKASGPRRAGAEREAINAPIQGTAADIMKIAMLQVAEALRAQGLRTRLLLQVHDELILEAPEEEVEAAKQLVREVMEGAYQLAVPLGVDVEVGPNWEEMG